MTTMIRPMLLSLLLTLVTGAQMWIGHDKTRHATLNFAPAYYE